jgi:pantoate--beta-alanine ligase
MPLPPGPERDIWPIWKTERPDALELWHTKDDLRSLDRIKKEGPIVLVPTMGALHEGHLSLVRQGAAFGNVVVTIFVNPTQFGPSEDFESYPKTLQQDLDLLSDLPVAGVFAPGMEEIYGPGQEVIIQPGHRSRDLCGSGRPGHFAGVLTVVAKLFGLVGPDVAIFGRKDAQQCLVIGQMVENLKMPIRLIDVATRREKDGLALSSRNRYLSIEQREQALCLHRSLTSGRHLLEAGCRNRAQVVEAMQIPLQAADRVEYCEVRQVPDLEISENIQGTTLLAVAAKVGPARLIDNFVLEVDNKQVSDGFLLGTGRKS